MGAEIACMEYTYTFCFNLKGISIKGRMINCDGHHIERTNRKRPTWTILSRGVQTLYNHILVLIHIR